MDRCDNCGHLMVNRAGKLFCKSCKATFAHGTWSIPGKEERGRVEAKEGEAELTADEEQELDQPNRFA